MSLQVEFVSPESNLYSAEATQVTARTRGGGEIAFLTGHEPFVGSLQPCEVRVTDTGGGLQRFAVRSGFVSVSPNPDDGPDTRVTVLSDAAQPVGDLDRATVEADLAEAQAAVAANDTDPYAREDLRWAEVRLAAIDGPDRSG